MTAYILLISVIILICLLLNKVSSKFGVPMLLVFIILGMLFGSDGIFKIDFANYDIAEKICSVSLIFIMFYGGFGTNWNSAKPVAVKAILLSSFGVVLTALITGVFCYYVLHFGFLESMLIGSVISSTDAASVFYILRSKKLNLKYNTASLLELESGSNDPFSYMMTIIVIALMSGNAGGSNLAYMVFSQVVYGVLFGGVVALLAYLILSKFDFAEDGFDTIFVFSMALLAYAGASAIGGNGYLSTYVAGIILGNVRIKNKRSLVHFFDGVTGLMQMLIFFLLGLLAFPSQLPSIMLAALAIALFLTFVARPITVFAILTPFKCPWRQQLVVSWAGLRGAASIVFAIMATVSPAYMKNDIFHIVFFIVLFSISIQGTLLPLISKKLDMIDDRSNVMKTFSDYSDENPIEFIRLTVSEEHPWANRKVKNLSLVPNLLLVMIIRDGEKIVPKGKTIILPNDIVVLSALSLEEEIFDGCLTEFAVESDNEWIGKPLSKIEVEDHRLIVIVKRNDRVIIPNGKTVIRENDVLVMIHL